MVLAGRSSGQVDLTGLGRRYLDRMNRIPRSALGLLGAVAVLLVGCSGGEDAGTTTTTVLIGSGDLAAFCQSARTLSEAGGLDLTTGAEGPLASVRAMAEQAPPALAGDFAVFLRGLDSVSKLEEDDPAALAAIVELLGNSEFAAAVNRIRDAAHEECGVDINVSTGPIRD